MDRNGIATAITSISQPGVHFGDDAAARALARRCNEDAAGCVERWPQRFGGFAVLPLPDVAGACAEAAYALDALHLDGVVLFASCGDRFLGDPAFDRVLDVLNERSAVVFVHPAMHPTAREIRLDLPLFVVEYVFDTTRAATNLIFSGALDRFPNIRFILAHAGGTLPYLASRLAASPLIDPGRLGGRSPDDIRAKIKHFWYDTALAFGPQTLAVLAAVADPKKILFGSDWPYAPETVTAETVRSLGPAPELRENALALFPRLAAR